MKPEIKKLLILNLPYLLFVWLFDKVGAAVRLSPGADASAKLLHLGDGFTAAFSSIAPSFHPADLALGIAGAVIVRLIIYTKGKNAKKYRRGTEYGSARWGGADDMRSVPNCSTTDFVASSARFIPSKLSAIASSMAFLHSSLSCLEMRYKSTSPFSAA